MNTILCYIYPDMADFEVVVALHRLRNAGKRRIITVAETKDAVVSQSGLRYVPDMTIREAADLDVEALIIPGGPINNDQNAILPLIRRLYAQGKLLAAICFGPQFLGRAGVLDRHAFTTSCTPEHITANEAKSFAGLLEDMMDDYNGDGKKLCQINEFVFMTPEQVDKITSTPNADGEDVVVNLNTNLETYNRYSNEIFGGESIICILGEHQYEEVKNAGGLLPLSELFDEAPQGAIDEFGIRLKDTQLYAYSPAARIFPDDAVIAIRKISTMSALTGKKKAEALHEYARDLFVKVVSFEFPDDVPTD